MESLRSQMEKITKLKNWCVDHLKRSNSNQVRLPILLELIKLPIIDQLTSKHVIHFMCFKTNV